MSNASLAEAALQYAFRGWRVFPVYGLTPDGTCECGRAHCPSAAKHPRIKKWPQEATTEEDKILRWWKASPSANIGIATGSESGVIVLDVDVPGALGNWTSTTLTSRTGRGLHFYFASNDIPVKTSVRKLGNGLDIRGEGGFVVAPPSRHTSGKLYEWLNPTATIEMVPAWVVTGDPI